MLARGEKLDLLVDKTDGLMSEADRFIKSGRALRRKMWWNNCKMKGAAPGAPAAATAARAVVAAMGGPGVGAGRAPRRQSAHDARTPLPPPVGAQS